jgi:hypothetical protein
MLLQPGYEKVSQKLQLSFPNEKSNRIVDYGYQRSQKL